MEDGPYCVSCKHLIGIRSQGELAGSYRYQDQITTWKCGHSKNTIPSEEPEAFFIDTVTGRRNRVYTVWLIKDVRLEHCKGNWYEEYVQPVRESSSIHTKDSTIGGQSATEIIFDEAAVKAGREAAEQRLKQLREKKFGNLASIKAEEL